MTITASFEAVLEAECGTFGGRAHRPADPSSRKE